MKTEDLVRARFGAEPLLGRGISNAKFRAGDVLVRVNENVAPAVGLARFRKAAFCAEIAGRVGVPVPEVLEVGTLPDGRPYSVERWKDGLPADLVRDDADRVRIWEAVGAAIAPVHAADLGGREGDFDLGYDGDGPTTSWEAHRARIVRILAEDAVLGFDDTEKARFAEALHALSFPLGLSHGDLKLDNVLLDPDTLAVRAILDWEIARFVPAAPGEVSTSTEPAVLPSKTWAVARGEAERAALLRGLGVPESAGLAVFAVSDVLMNLDWYASALRTGERPDTPILRERLRNYVAGVREDLERVREALEADDTI